MKLNTITASLLTVISSQLLAPPAFADRIIQRPSGTFYIVSDREAYEAFDRNNFGFLALPPSVNVPSFKSAGKRVSKKRAEKYKPVKPTATIEPAESIFLRLEQKK